MSDEKKLTSEELSENELDKVTGGNLEFQKPEGGRCPLCGYMCFYDDEMTYINIDGVRSKVCKKCAGQ